VTRRGAILFVLALSLAACSEPPQPTAPLRQASEVDGALGFVVIGDFGSGAQAEYDVARAIRAWSEDHPVDALVTTGDNIYENGHPERFDEAWHRPYGWLEDQGIEVVASLGNHDIRTDDGQPVMRLLEMPWFWFSHRLGPVEFVVLDGNRPDDEDQARFMRTVLRESEAAWQVVLIHQPPYSCADEHGSSEASQELVPAMAQDGADLVLSGHDHTYQRFPEIQGITFVVSGGGGHYLDGLAPCPEGTPQPQAAFADTHHFLFVRASEEALTIRAVRVPGSEVADAVRLGE
jgi:3',5'-cyclic AMP phosphodiesterase CpdA